MCGRSSVDEHTGYARAGRPGCTRRRRVCLLRLGHARHVEVGDPQRRRRRAGEVVVAPLAAEARHRRRGVREPAEQVDRALVEPEVVDRAGDLAALDEVDAVAGQAGEQQGLRVDLADVPEAGQQQPALGAGDQVVLGAAARRRRTSTRLSIAGVTGWPVIAAECRVWSSDGQLAVADPVGAAERQAVVEDRATRCRTRWRR